ncbi:mycothiol acetyltransferase [Klenkia taihuensis]|uniref:Mycothiol acetyltransferase n=1 Tax=Klenkia taihuensis TaxID=1225127 RepID=A0A1I1J0U1_9ACTN|nr:mycothiol acetyltransferase [Klenkia taihuensis]SFC42199.1 mycothiol synthase [Klenkia taihuensis]
MSVVPRSEGAVLAAAVEALEAAAREDGVRPLSEEAELRLRHGGPDDGRDVLLHHADGPAGYARLDRDGDGWQAEFVVHPRFRRRGLGAALAAQLEELAGDDRLAVWAHGELPGSTELGTARGWTRARTLLQMRMPLAGVDPDPSPALPDDVVVRPFRPGVDEDAWLAVNAAAFAHHPEQGGMTRRDLELREAEEWFDPAGFLLAWRTGPDGETLLGSHWTKVHPPGEAADEAVGEVYVLGIAPQAQGLRLGRALTDLGLAHLRGRGLGEVLLYVEADNTAAVSLYEKSGFTRFSADVQWHREAVRA